MPIPADTVRTNITWQMRNGEIAVNTLHFEHNHESGVDLDWDDVTQRYADLVIDAMVESPGRATFFGAVDSGVSVRNVRAYHLNTEGRTIEAKTALPPNATDLKGTAGGNPLPPEVALVVSLYGYAPGQYVPDGARRRGRIYLGGLSTNTLEGSGLVGGGYLTAICNYWTAVMNYCHGRNMNSEIGGADEAYPVVLSRKFGERHRIQQVRVDNLFDVQRRRQNALIPTVVTGTVSEP